MSGPIERSPGFTPHPISSDDELGDGAPQQWLADGTSTPAPSDQALACVPPDPEDLVSRDPAPRAPPGASGAPLPAGASSLVAKFERQPAALPPGPQLALGPRASPADGVLSSTSPKPHPAPSTPTQGGVRSVGVVAMTEDGLHAHGALGEGEGKLTGARVQAVTGSLDVGSQGVDAQLAGARVSKSFGPVSAAGEALTARAYLKGQGDDGSTGLHAGLGLSAATATAVYTDGDGAEVTAGYSAGPGISAGVGLRDADRDGVPELCVSGSYGVVVGVCSEGVEAVGSDPTVTEGASGTGGTAPVTRSAAPGASGGQPGW